MALLVTVGAFNARPVARLRALATLVAVFVTIAALDLGHVPWLRTLTGGVTLAIAVAADDDPLLGAVFRTVAFLLAIATDFRLTLRAVAREVPH